jgi:immune inhibitor A
MNKLTHLDLVNNIIDIYQAAALSNDGHRCMIAPSPQVKEELKRDLNRLKSLASSEILSNLLTPKQQDKLGFNDGLVMPGNVFPLGTSAMEARKLSLQREPLHGTLRVIVVLVEFPDKKMNETKEHYEDLFFSKGKVSTGSVYEYYQEVTNGLVTIQGEVSGPYMLPRPIADYANGESGTGKTEPNARTMAYDTAVIADPAVNFSKYDNDGDGYVDAFVVIHAGEGAEETASKSDIWSHKWLLPQEYQADGTKVYSYLTVPESCKLGVCAHELGHLLFAFPDLYDTDYSSEGVGDWCLMGGGSWNNGGDTPAHPCAWCKAQQGWVQVVNQSSNKKAVAMAGVIDSRKVYRLWQKGNRGNEYFLLENRQQRKFDKFLPGNGLLIWHIDDEIDNNSNEQHYRVALLQADGKKDLERGANRGDNGDPWPGSGTNKTFNKDTVPDSRSYGGLDTQVQVQKIGLKNGVITADLYVSSKAIKKPKKIADKIVVSKKVIPAKSSKKGVGAKRVVAKKAVKKAVPRKAAKAQVVRVKR